MAISLPDPESKTRSGSSPLLWALQTVISEGYLPCQEVMWRKK